MFKSEKALVECILSSIEEGRIEGSITKQRGELKLFTELNLGYGIPDIVLTYYKNDANVMRKAVLSYFDLSVLQLVRSKGALTIDQIHELTQMPKQKIRKTLEKLSQDEIITFKNDQIASYKKYIQLVIDSVAIEAKLTAWKQALYQAYRYKSFSQKSFVLLPEENINPANENLELFKKFDIGLGYVNKQIGVRILFDPPARQPVSAQRAMLLNEYLVNSLPTIH